MTLAFINPDIHRDDEHYEKAVA